MPSNWRSEVDRELKARGWRRQDLAAAAGVSKGVLSRLLNPDSNPTVESVERVAAALGREIAYTFVPKDEANGKG